MYAIVQVGSSQFRVSEGDTILPNRLSDEIGKDVILDKVLVFAKDKDVRIGQPFVDGVKISAKVVKQTQGEKVIAFKYRRRKDSASKKGHRQQLTALNITKISG